MAENPDIARFTPELPDHGDAEHASVEARTKLRLDRERDHTSREIAKALNYPIDLPLPTVESTRPHNQVSYKDLEHAKKTKSKVEYMKFASKVFFNKDMDVKGLGYVVRGIEQLQPDQLGAVVRQLAAAPQKDLKIMDKFKMSLMRTTAEWELENRKYVYDPSSAKGAETGGAGTLPSDKRSHRVLNGETIEKIIKQLGPEAEAMWQQVVAGIRVGPLANGGLLPGGMYLRFDEKGRPIFIASDDKTPTPEVPQFQKNVTAKTSPTGVADSKEIPVKNERDRAIDFLIARLKPGDILFMNARKRKNIVRRGAVIMGRLMSATDQEEENFHAVHVGVYVGDGMLVDVSENAGKKQPLVDVMRTSCSSVTVGRLGDSSKVEAFTREAEKIALKVTKYNYGEAYNRVREFSKSKATGERVHLDKADPRVNSTICVDVVAQAAKATGINELKDTRSAIDMLHKLDLPLSIDVDNPRGFRG